MFYCDECAEKNALGKTIFKSYGSCELCKKTKECNDSGKQEIVREADPPASQHWEKMAGAIDKTVKDMDAKEEAKK